MFNGKLGKEDTDAFNQSKNILANSIHDENVAQHITIVRTGCPGFRNKEKCKRDLEDIIKESEVNAEMIRSCNHKLIHVDNPSLNPKDFSEEIEVNKKRREASRKILLDHLINNCQRKLARPRR